MCSQFFQQELKLPHRHSEICMKVAVITASTHPQVTGTTCVLTNKLLEASKKFKIPHVIFTVMEFYYSF